MAILRRVLEAVLGLALLAAGGYGLALALAPDSAIAESLGSALVGAASGMPLPSGSIPKAEALLSGPLLRYTLAPLGLVLLLLSVKPSGRGRRDADADSPAEGGAAPVDKRLVKKTVKAASQLARKGQYADAAEMLFACDQMEKAVDYFIKAGEFVRAAEIRHDQNRFAESAELYVEAGDFSSAGLIFGQQEDYARAADCYLKADSKSTAAEMFEKAGDHRRAGDCYVEVEFLRHAAQAYVKCQAWPRAAECLEQVYDEESVRMGADPKRAAEMRKLVQQAGKLHQRSGNHEKAAAILEKGGCPVEAAEIAMHLEQYGRAAELFKLGDEPVRAAEALERLGESGEAARILGEYHRQRGDLAEAAASLEQAEDFVAAGDLYRQLEDYPRAGECYVRQSEFAQAAEMFRLAGDRGRAADAYERAGRYTEAAECCALAGMGEREGELLEKAGEFMSAGEAYHREGMDDAAIRVLQQVPSESEGFARAAALLGDIFQARGQLSLAVKKLRQAIEGQDIERDNLPIYYALATVHEANQELSEACEIYERILALDYHFGDVEERLVRLREHLPPPEASAPESGGAPGSGASTQSGRYKITGELGRGGMGIVYKAEDSVLDRTVAYKVLPDTLKENPQALKNFMREAKAAAKLNHPNIVTVYDTGEQDGRFYIAMEYVDGTTLKEILRRRGPISPAGILHVMVQVCEALEYAHEKKVVHRDIKTANTMWTRDKKAKIMDFGLAKVVEEVRNHTTVVSGTPYYMSPEQTLGKNVDHRTDIYSLGVTMFELAAGTVPFKEGNIPYHHVHTPPPDVRSLRPEVPASMAAIINRCLEKDADARYQSAGEILEQIRSSLARASGSSSG